MARKTKDNRWNDIDGGSAFLVPLTLLRHPNFVRLSSYGNKLIMDLARQYTGFNNGHLCASWALMKDCGWRSSHTLQGAMLECEHYGLLKRTRQGGLNKATLHAFTWRRIDDKPGKPLDVRSTMAPSDDWKEARPFFVRPAPRPRRKAAPRRLRRAA